MTSLTQKKPKNPSNRLYQSKPPQAKNRTRIKDVMTNKSNRLYTNENPPHFIHDSKTIAYGVIVVNVFHRKLMRFHRNKRPNWCALYFL